MEINTFIKDFAEQFEETDQASITGKTKFRELEEWSSMLALALIAMVDENYNVKLKGEDIKQAESVQDLYQVVKSRL